MTKSKSKNKSIKVVQFLHSGKEYKLSECKNEAGKITKPWNYGLHRRKFLHAKGIYIENGKKIGDEENWKDIYFWGEWEPESKVTPIVNQESGDYPHSIHEPFVEIEESEKLNVPGPITQKDKDGSIKKNEDGSTIQFIATNTDPFVFGKDGFYYSCCKQNRKGNPTQMQDLEPGSIILFGSRIKDQETGNPYFALDTVFVVGPNKNKKNQYKLKYKINSDLKDLHDFAPDYYCDIMNYKDWGNNSNHSCNGNELAGCRGSSFTCYHGARYDDPIIFDDDPTKIMYSFVPCKIGKDGKKGFERVKLTKDSFQKISKKAIISYNQCQGVKYSETNNIKDNFDFWKNLRDYIIGEGYYEAVRLKYAGEK